MWEALVTPSLCTKVMRLVLAWGYNSKPQQGCCKGMGKGDCTLHLPATTCFLKITCYCFLTADCSLQSATQHILYPSTYSLLDPFSWCYFFFFPVFKKYNSQEKKNLFKGQRLQDWVRMFVSDQGIVKHRALRTWLSTDHHGLRASLCQSSTKLALCQKKASFLRLFHIHIFVHHYAMQSNRMTSI